MFESCHSDQEFSGKATLRGGFLYFGPGSTLSVWKVSMRSSPRSLPYFDILLEQLQQGDETVRQVFGRHVHWGYWPLPETADGSAGDFSLAAERLAQQVYAGARVQENDCLLDVGCGFGGTIASLNESFGALQLTGLNIDPRQLDRARQEVKPRANNRIAFVAGDACRMPIPDASMDVVLAVECIFHFPSRRDFFHEARRVLRPGGRLSLSDFVPIAVYRFLQRGFSAVGEAFVAGTYGRVDSCVTLSDYRALAAEAGFTLTEQRDVTRNTLPTYPVVRDVFARAGNHPAARATAAVGLLSKLGGLRYRILHFSVAE